MKSKKTRVRISTAIIINPKPLDVFDHVEKFLAIVKSVAIEYGSDAAAQHVAEESFAEYVKNVLELPNKPTATRIEIVRPAEIKKLSHRNISTQKQLDDLADYMMATFSIKFDIRSISDEEMQLLEQGRSAEAIDLIFKN